MHSTRSASLNSRFEARIRSYLGSTRTTVTLKAIGSTGRELSSDVLGCNVRALGHLDAQMASEFQSFDRRVLNLMVSVAEVTRPEEGHLPELRANGSYRVGSPTTAYPNTCSDRRWPDYSVAGRRRYGRLLALPNLAERFRRPLYQANGCQFHNDANPTKGVSAIPAFYVTPIPVILWCVCRSLFQCFLSNRSTA